MRRLLCVLALFALFVPDIAWSACAGRNLFTELEASDPAAAAEVAARAAAVPNAEGLFWRVEKPGVPASYLYGTHHASAGVKFVPEAAWRTLEQSRVAVFELSGAEYEGMQRRMQTDPAMILDPDAPPFAELMSKEDLEQVRLLYRARGMAIEAVQRMRLWLQVSLISFPPCQIKASAMGEKGVDQLMIDRAQAAGIPDFGLETSGDALKAFEKLSREAIVKMIIASARYREMEEDLFQTSMELYGAGRVAMIYEFSMSLSERMMPDADLGGLRDWMVDDLIEGRNARWMPKLLPHLEAGGAFVAVGALHLPGEGGLVELLRREGYEVTRVR